MEINLSTSNSRDLPVVTVKFSIGFGNNLFQYIFSRLLAEHHGLKHAHPFLPGFNIKSTECKPNHNFDTICIRQEKHVTGAYKKYFGTPLSKSNYDVVGYFEDYSIYAPHLSKIKSWFPKVKKRNKNDLVLHLRLQNRIVQTNHFLNLIKPSSYAKVLKKFNYKKLHIVTDLEKWEKYSTKDILKIKKDLLNGPNPGVAWISTEDSLLYVNALIKTLSKFNPTVHCSKSPTIYGSGGLRGHFMPAFNFIRSFNQVILYNSTFSWWAAVLSGASRVAVFSMWKPGREDNNPNLGSTNYDGWFNYGSKKDLISNDSSYSKYKILNWEQRHKRSTLINRIIKILRMLLFRKSHNPKRDYR